MAKWGEGDPRWLVTSREDGKNVNQWHWEEINKIDWAKKRLAELLEGFSIDDAAITKVKDVSGEASVMVRRGAKKVANFDLKLVLKWKSKKEGEEAKGEIKIREFANVNEPDEYEFEVKVDKSEHEERYKNLWNSGKTQITTLLEQFTKEFQDS